MGRYVCTTVGESDWHALFFVAFGGDAPEDGWPEDVALSLTDAPEAALMCSFGEHSAMQKAMSSEAALAVAWDDFRIEPWAGVMVLPAGKRLRYRSEHSRGLRCS
jgi:hypothetical protein